MKIDIEIINKGADHFNSWRKSNPLEKINFNSRDLKGFNFENYDLRYASFVEANLENANLKGACLRYTNFTHATLIKANMEGADLRKALIFNAFLDEANLSHADLRDAILDYSFIRNAKLKDTKLKGIKTHETFFTGSLSRIKIIWYWTIGELPPAMLFTFLLPAFVAALFSINNLTNKIINSTAAQAIVFTTSLFFLVIYGIIHRHKYSKQTAIKEEIAINYINSLDHSKLNPLLEE